MDYIGKKLIVRTNRAGVFFGTLAEYDKANREARLTNVRRIHYWEGAASLSQMAVEGVKKPLRCRFTMVVPDMKVSEVIERIPCSEAAITNIESVPVWKM